jgi:hypothetical protein
MNDVGVIAMVFGDLYGGAVFAACLWLYVEHDAPIRGLLWRAAPQPFLWLRPMLLFALRLVLPPERRPRPTRAELERRIAELERELSIEELDAP